MTNSISIRPSKDIRTNYAQISALTRDNPVAITVIGKEDTVLLSHEDYQQTMHYISELEECCEALGIEVPCKLVNNYGELQFGDDWITL